MAEQGSSTAVDAWGSADSIAINRLLYPEGRAALAAARRARRLTARDHSLAKQALEDLWRQADVVEITALVAGSAGDLAERHGLRGYDSVHLAAALAVAADVMVCADGDLLGAAAAERIAVVDART